MNRIILSVLTTLIVVTGFAQQNAGNASFKNTNKSIMVLQLQDDAGKLKEYTLSNCYFFIDRSEVNNIKNDCRINLLLDTPLDETLLKWSANSSVLKSGTIHIKQADNGVDRTYMFTGTGIESVTESFMNNAESGMNNSCSLSIWLKVGQVTINNIPVKLP